MEDPADGGEGVAPTATPSLAMPPCNNPNKEAMRKVNLSTLASPPSEKVFGVMCAAGGG
jgi:hypothetical protein